MIRSPISTFFFSVWPLENLRWYKWLEFFWCFPTGQHCSRQQEWFVQRPRGSAVCAEAQGVWRTGRHFSLFRLGVGRELVRVGEVAGQQQHEGASEPFNSITGGEFPGGPVVKTLCFYRRDHRFNPLAWGTKIFHAVWRTPPPTPKASLKAAGRILSRNMP